MTDTPLMKLENDVRYLLDRIAIQDVIAKYGLGQDLHQGDDEDQNLLDQWSGVFTSDATIDASEVGLSSAISLTGYVQFMRGKDAKGTEGLGKRLGLWQHREGYATVTLQGDNATAISPFFHTHETRDGKAQLVHTGLWFDQLERRAEGWRIVHRRLKNGFFHTLPRMEDAEID